MPRPPVDAMIAAAIVAVEEHGDIGPGFGISPGVDLHWRLGHALTAVVGNRMPYDTAGVTAVATALRKIYGKGFNRTVIFDSRRLYAACPRRTDLPRGLSWMKVRRILCNGALCDDAFSRTTTTTRPCTAELRRLARRAMRVVAPQCLDIRTADPHHLAVLNDRRRIDIWIDAVPRRRAARTAAVLLVTWASRRLVVRWLGRSGGMTADAIRTAILSP